MQPAIHGNGGMVVNDESAIKAQDHYCSAAAQSRTDEHGVAGRGLRTGEPGWTESLNGRTGHAGRSRAVPAVQDSCSRLPPSASARVQLDRRALRRSLPSAAETVDLTEFNVVLQSACRRGGCISAITANYRACTIRSSSRGTVSQVRFCPVNGPGIAPRGKRGGSRRRYPPTIRRRRSMSGSGAGAIAATRVRETADSDVPASRVARGHRRVPHRRR